MTCFVFASCIVLPSSVHFISSNVRFFQMVKQKSGSSHCAIAISICGLLLDRGLSSGSVLQDFLLQFLIVVMPPRSRHMLYNHLQCLCCVAYRRLLTKLLSLHPYVTYWRDSGLGRSLTLCIVQPINTELCLVTERFSWTSHTDKSYIGHGALIISDACINWLR